MQFDAYIMLLENAQQARFEIVKVTPTALDSLVPSSKLLLFFSLVPTAFELSIYRPGRRMECPEIV